MFGVSRVSIALEDSGRTVAVVSGVAIGAPAIMSETLPSVDAVIGAAASVECTGSMVRVTTGVLGISLLVSSMVQASDESGRSCYCYRAVLYCELRLHAVFRTSECFPKLLRRRGRVYGERDTGSNTGKL